MTFELHVKDAVKLDTFGPKSHYVNTERKRNPFSSFEHDWADGQKNTGHYQ